MWFSSRLMMGVGVLLLAFLTLSGPSALGQSASVTFGVDFVGRPVTFTLIDHTTLFAADLSPSPDDPFFLTLDGASGVLYHGYSLGDLGDGGGGAFESGFSLGSDGSVSGPNVVGDSGSGVGFPVTVDGGGGFTGLAGGSGSGSGGSGGGGSGDTFGGGQSGGGANGTGSKGTQSLGGKVSAAASGAASGMGAHLGVIFGVFLALCIFGALWLWSRRGVGGGSNPYEENGVAGRSGEVCSDCGVGLHKSEAEELGGICFRCVRKMNQADRAGTILR